MTNDLIPTPVLDKNGKLTTVHKKPAGASLGSENIASVPPVTYAVPAPVSEALTAAQAEGFLSSFCPVDIASDLSGSSRYATDVQRTFRALSGETQAVLKKLYDYSTLDDEALMDVVTSFGEGFQGYGRIPGQPSRMAEPVLRTSAKIFDLAITKYPAISDEFSPAGLFEYSKQVLLGCMDHAVRKGVQLDPRSDDDIEAVMGVFSFIMKSDTSRLRETFFADDQGSGHRSIAIDSDTVAEFVMKHPDLAERAAVFMRERNLGNSETESQFMIEHFNETAEAPSISSGRL